MYKFNDYLNRGFVFLRNTLFPYQKKLSTIMIYTTDLCNARCKHCYIWNKKPKQTLSFESIKNIIQSNVITKNTLIGLEGGEFILHPECEEILHFFSIHHPKFDVLSNCVDAQKLITLIKKYPSNHLYLSLDGGEFVHNEIRGVKNLYPKVLKVINELKNTVPISVMFTLTPFNSFDDLRYVISICKKYGVDLRVGIYGNMEYFDTKEKATEASVLNFAVQDIPKEIKDFDENYDFIALYTSYRSNEINLPCYSIRDSIVIYPNGDIPLCQNKQIILGNINNEPLEEIVNKKNTVNLHKKYCQCNGCWINFHRKYDVVLFRSMEKLLPKILIELFFGKYKWGKSKNLKYKHYLNKQLVN